ncbi:MAG: ABC transporter ATP-binding protein, partial [Treponema sp.]|jgi:zinc transport system ATP-binding protein|nr:ABC transporter ATP-binding protein [Treponema sp.]
LLYKTLGEYKGKVTILVVTHDTEFVTSLTDRVLCLGDGRKIVQHRTEANAAAMNRHGGAGPEVRVLHEENITSDECCMP